MKVELTDEVIKIIKNCEYPDVDNSVCEKHCPLFEACLKYYTSYNSENKED